MNKRYIFWDWASEQHVHDIVIRAEYTSPKGPKSQYSPTEPVKLGT